MHDVKAHDILIGMRRDLRPTQEWLIHGFRQKPAVAEMLMRAGFRLSIGAEFNPDTLSVIPRDQLLTETDDSSVSIEEVITKIETISGEKLRDQIIKNAGEFLKLRMEK